MNPLSIHKFSVRSPTPCLPSLLTVKDALRARVGDHVAEKRGRCDGPEGEIELIHAQNIGDSATGFTDASTSSSLEAMSTLLTPPIGQPRSAGRLPGGQDAKEKEATHARLPSKRRGKSEIL